MSKKRLFLVALILSCNLGIYAQGISLRLRNVTVAKAMTELRKKTGYSFVYEGSDLNTRQRVNVDAKDLRQAADQILGSQNVTYTIQGKNIVVSAKSKQSQGQARPQNTVKKEAGHRTVKGHVTDENGEPIIGASVRVKGSSMGAVTDLDGNYILSNVPDDATLEISYIGYSTKEILSGMHSQVDINMKENVNVLNEVVAVGYGTQKKVTVTGAIASTKGSDLAEVPTANITNTLAGRMPGLISYNRSGEPGYDDAGLLIRGASTIGDSSPLLVVDGVADRAGTLGRIDPNDIESVTILKDASAAIYGSRAANGVILVTTKRGAQERLTVKYNGNIGFTHPTILPKMASSAQYAELLNEINPGTYSDKDIELFRNGSDPIGHPNIDAFDTMLRAGVQTQHNASVSGGSKNIQFYTSLGYQYQDNYYKNSASDYNQYNSRSNIDFELSKDLKISTDISFRQEDRNSPVTGSEDIWRYLIKYNPMVNIWFPGTDYGNVSSKQDNFSPATGMDNTMGYQRDRRSYLSADLTAHLSLPWITQGLSLDGGIYFDRSDVFYKNFQKKYYLYSYDDGNYTPVQQGQNVLYENMNKTTGITMNARISYGRTFGPHHVDAFVAWEQYKSRYDYLYGRRQDFTSTLIDELFAGDSNSATNDGTATETARLNYFGRVDYDFSGKYLLQFNWRYDGSEKFPERKAFRLFPRRVRRLACE